MKRIIAICLSIMIFSTFMYNDTVDVKATSVAVAIGAEVTGEAIFSLLCTLFIATGIINAVDDTIDINSLNDSEKQDLYHQLREEYRTLCNTMIEEGTLEWTEFSSALDILNEYDNVDEACEALANEINFARESL